MDDRIEIEDVGEFVLKVVEMVSELLEVVDVVKMFDEVVENTEDVWAK